jgi:hypothetical protein
MNDMKLHELSAGPQDAKNAAINDAAIKIGYVAAMLRLIDTALLAGYDGGLHRNLDIADDAASACRVLAEYLDEANGIIVELT